MHDFPPLLYVVFLAVVAPLDALFKQQERHGFFFDFIFCQYFFIVGLNSAPNIRFIVEPADALVSKGQEVRFDCAIAGADDESVDVQWRLNGITLDRRMRTYVLPNSSLVIPPTANALLSAQLSDRTGTDYCQCVVTVNNQWVYVSRKAKLHYVDGAHFKEEPSNRHVAEGSTVIIPCRIQGGSSASPVKVTWFKDGAPLPDMPKRITTSAEGGFLEIRSVQFSDNGLYSCKADVGGETLSSRQGRLAVTSKSDDDLKFEVKPKNQRVDVGGSAFLLCSVNGRLKPKVVWLKGSAEVKYTSRIRLVGESSLLLADVQPDDRGTDEYVFALKYIGSIVVKIHFHIEALPDFSSRPENVVGLANEAITFRCEAKGYPSPAITWYKNGEVLKSSEYFMVIFFKSSIFISGLVKNDQGIYQCLAENDVGSVQSSAVLLVEASDSPAKLLIAAGSREPTGLQAVHVSSRYVMLRWNSPTAWNQTLTGYSVFYKSLDTQREHQVNCTPPENREYTISGLLPKKTYYFRVVPISSIGYGSSSSTISVVTAEEKDNPSAVQHLNAYAVSSTSIQIQWDPPETHAREPVKFYKIFYAAVGASSQSDLSPSAGLDVEETEIQSRNTAYVLHGTKEFTKYRIRVEAFRGNGTSHSSAPVYVRTFSDKPTATPTAFSVLALTSDKALVRWSPPPADGCNGEIVSYRIRYKMKDRGSRSQNIVVGSPKMETTVNSKVDRPYAKGQTNLPYLVFKDLIAGATYVFRVAAATINGTGPFTPWKEVVMTVYDGEESHVPGGPTSLHLQATSNEISLTWTPPRDDGNLIRGYLVGWGINVPDIETQRVPGNSRTFVIRKLRPNKDYVVSLKAFNRLGNGFPIYETVRTEDKSSKDVSVSVETPIGLRAVTLSSTAISLSWTDRNQGTLPPNIQNDERYYTVRYTSHYVSGGRYRYVNTSESSYVIDGLKPDTQYEFSVKAALGRFESEWSMTAFNKTFSSGTLFTFFSPRIYFVYLTIAAPSSAPRDLTTIDSDSDPTSVLLNWQPPKHPNGKITSLSTFLVSTHVGKIETIVFSSEYLIYYTSEPKLTDSSWMIEGIRGDRMSTTIDGLIPEKDYFFKIQAVNDRGYGPVSAVKPYRARRMKSVLGPVDSANRVPGVIHAEATSTGSPNADTSFSWNALSLIIAVVSGIVVILVIALVVYLYRQRKGRTRGYTAGVKKTLRDSKPPPDLWIHHEHHSVEMRGVEGKNSGLDGSSFCDLMQMKSCRTPTPPMPDVPRYQSLARQFFLVENVQPANGSLSRKRHHLSSNSVDAAALNSPRSCAVGHSQKAPQVVYTGQKASARAQLLMSDCSASEECVPTSPMPTPPVSSGGGDSHSDASGPTGRSSNPLKSFALLSVPPPPPPPISNISPNSTAGRMHLVRPTTVVGPSAFSSPKSRASNNSGSFGSKGKRPQAHVQQQQQQPSRSSPSSQRMTGSVSGNNGYVGKDADCEVMRSYSTEELTAQMQNLDNLMQDLNAISANEFDL
ncbi:Netrin receptor DCC [Trichuris trichiura]|uniref:Netrin receptor DCC n=1 Tax=Trichuris trichiura TaxID=36087 RepID=A0A077ZBT8_TRITR|nr:Netrin receptor DCC [Trichuris trichiura]